MKPGRSLFIAALLWFFLGAAAFFSQFLFLAWTLAGAALLPFIIADALILRFLTDPLNAQRELPLSLAQGEQAGVTISFSRGNKPLLPAAVFLYDLYPASMDAPGNVFPARLNPGLLKNAPAFLFSYTVIPRSRGSWVFPALHLLLSSPLRFWKLKVVHPCASRGRTYPDFKKLAGGGEIRGLMADKGQREIRRRGQGLEFMSLRDYQEGDPIRSIDWRATSRRQKLIIREYQEEQDQQILFVLDSGYRLPEREFDSALNGMLLLSYTALKHGDAVAALTFGAAERWFPPRKGMSTLTSLMNGLYDLESLPVPSSPFSALETALARLHRRTFIILVSNFREEDGESLSWILPRLRRRHLLLMVSFREAGADELAFRKAPARDSDTLETAAAFSYIAARERLYQSWEHRGLLTLQTTPDNISSALINRYLSVKRSGRL